MSPRWSARVRDSDVRTLRVDGREVLRAAAFVVRDPQWRTLPLAVESRESVESDGRVALRIVATAPRPVPARLALEVRAEGETATFVGRAEFLDDVSFNRVGWCLQHPLEGHRGAHVRLSEGGHEFVSRLPGEISPQPLIDGAPAPLFGRGFDRLVISPDGLGELDFTFDGDTFELEDQRNWSDASFKSYSTPITLPRPHRRRRGEVLEQSIVLTLRGSRDPSPAKVDEALIGTLPRVSLWSGRTAPGAWAPPGGFVELNRTRMPPDTSSVALAINGAVHASDAESLFESTATHGELVDQSRRLSGGLPVDVGPLDFDASPGEWFAADGSNTFGPPREPGDPRRATGFGAAWMLTSLASAVPAGPRSLAYFSERLPSAAPAARLAALLTRHAGRPVVVRRRGPLVDVEVADLRLTVNRTADPAQADGRTLHPYELDIQEMT